MVRKPTGKRPDGGFTVDYEKELNAEQLAVVRGADGPCVVLAGAGSGKTRTIVYRVAYLMEQGVDPEHILLLTFTNKAAREMMGRIVELLGTGSSFAKASADQIRPAGAGRIWGGTFHSVANRLLRIFAESAGFKPNFTILDEDDSKALLKACMKELGYDNKSGRFPSPAVVKQVLSFARNAMISIEESLEKLHPKLTGFAEDFAKIAESYDRKKRESNAMDFDDLLIRLYDLLKKDDSVRKKLASRFRYILVDEYQDTNALQAALIRLLAVGDKPNLLVVGDDAQSIYSFRAAEVRNILDFGKSYPGSKIFKLLTNYRSAPEILDLANDIISRNVNQYPKELRSVGESVPKPRVASAASARQEARFIADSIEELESRGVSMREVAVLFRATHHSQTLEFELTARGIEYEYRGGMRFFERAHVKDTLAFMRIIENFADESAWRRVLGLQVGIGIVTAGKIFAIVRKSGSLASAVLCPVEQTLGPRVARGWKDVRDTMDKLMRFKNDPAGTIKAITESPYADYLENEYANADERMDDIGELASFAESYGSVGDFLSEVSLDDSAHRSAGAVGYGRGERLVLSTIHQAKGLEWDSVFLMHMNESSFPNRRAVFEKGGLEEERRLFYVAVTRAKRNLCLSHPISRRYESLAAEQPSMFLQELDFSCIDTTLMDVSEVSADGDADCEYGEPAVEIGEDGEVETDDMNRIKKRMAKVRKSYLIDV